MRPAHSKEGYDNEEAKELPEEERRALSKFFWDWAIRAALREAQK